MASVLIVVNASTPSFNNVAEQGNVTYIVGFNDNNGQMSVMDDQMSAFVSDNNAQILYKFDSINAVAITVPAEAAGKLSSLKGVKYAHKEIKFHATLDKSTGIVSAPVAWNSGYTGKGIKVAVIDTGIDGSHPDLKGRIVQWKDFVGGKESAYDDMGHGTHCAGIIGGNGAGSNGKYKGVAPEVQFIGIKVLGKDGSGSESDILKGIEYAMNSDAKVISMSLGSDQHSPTIHDMVTKAIQKGKIVVVAAGNSGPKSGTVGCPSDVKDAITVGATDKSDNIASFSSRGPTKDGLIKPDVCAPGKDIISCRATGIKNDKAIENYYMSMSGTSMACPMVSGSVALLLQKDPSITPAKAKEILTASSKRIGQGCPNNDYGYGRVDIKNAIDYMDGKYKPPVASPTPTPSVRPSPTPTTNPGNPNPGYPYPGNPYPGNPGNPNPGYPYPGSPYPGNPYPGYPYPGYPYPGYPYPGYPYPGYPYNSGESQAS